MATEPAHAISDAATLAARDVRQRSSWRVGADVPSGPGAATSDVPTRSNTTHPDPPGSGEAATTVTHGAGISGQSLQITFVEAEDRDMREGAGVETVDDVKAILSSLANSGLATSGLTVSSLPTSRITLGVTSDRVLLPALATVIVAAEELGTSVAHLNGSIRHDTVTALVAGNTRSLAPQHAMRIVADVIEHGAAHFSRLKPVTISGAQVQATGAPHALELALTLAAGREYVQTAMARGLGLDEFASQVEFAWAVGRQFYLEVAKLRAGRQLWRRMMKDLGATSTESLTLHASVQTPSVPAMAQMSAEAHMRSALEAMAAAFGGTQPVADTDGDAPTGPAETVLHEAHITEIDDPWAGSYMMESLTQDMVRATSTWLADIEAQGGMIRCIESGWLGARLPAGTQLSSGTPRSPMSAPHEDVGRADIAGATTGARCRCALHVVPRSASARTRAGRHEPTVERLLTGLAAATRHGQRNLLRLTIAAVRARATLHEVSAVLEGTTDHSSVPPLDAARPAGVQALPSRTATTSEEIDSFVQRAGRRPRILIARGMVSNDEMPAVTLGEAFARHGFDVDIGLPVRALDECVPQVVDDDVHAVGVLRADIAHVAQVPALADALRRDGLSGVPVFVMGITDAADYDFLYGCGVASVYTGSQPSAEEASELLWHIRLLSGWHQ